ncbi:MAG: hypothetical protein IPL53_08330 [Ignavibacteria bacterium]|nr:hypothetical protein [Ignavibacteria bacterium]
MKTFIIFLLLFTNGIIFSQDFKISNNPYEKADKITRSRKAFQREKWFYEQRMYPDNFIPKDAYEKAYAQKENLRKQSGYLLMSPFDTWASVGPSPGFYFGNSNITSRMATVKYDPLNPDIIYIGAACGGIWKSVNGGATWTAKSDYEVSLSSGSIAIDPSNTNIIYYGTGEATYSGVSYYGRGLLKSANAGSTWTNISSDLPLMSYTSRIAIRPGNPSQLLAAMSYDGLYKSTNSGNNWTKILSGRCDDVLFSPAGDTVYVIGSGTGYKVSTDGGVNFYDNTSLIPGERNHIALCRSYPAIMFASIYNSGNITVFKSTNAGANFTQIANGQDFSGVQGWYDFYMHVNPFDPNTAYVGSIDIWRTTNGGTNFINLTNGYSGGNVHVDQHNLDFHPVDANQMICVNDGGIWKSTNKGSNWTNLNTNLTLTQFYRIASDPSNANHIIGGTQDNGTQRTTGTLNWAAAFGGDGGEVCFHKKNNNYILGETQNNGVVRSSDGGLSWYSAQDGLSGNGAWIGPLISHPDSNGIFYTAREQVFKTTDWGMSWFAISSGTSGIINEMAISRTSSDIMYATLGRFIFKSTNRGYTFADVTTGLPDRGITSFNIHPDSSQVAIITFSGFGEGKIFKTTDGGAGWINITGNLPDAPANDALFYYPGISTPTYYLANDVGVFVTNNNGQSWIELANGLPNTVVMHLDYHQTANKLRAGTHGRGVFEIQINSTVVDVQSLSLGVTGLQLFSSSTVIPTGKVRNNSPAAVTFMVTRKINPGGYSSTKTVSSLASGAAADVTFFQWTFSPGTVYTIQDSVYIAGDLNTLNNILKGTITPNLGEYITLVNEGFFSPVFPPAGWNIEATGFNYISRSSASSYGTGNGSLKYDNWNYNPGTEQSVITPVFQPSAAGDSIRFDHAYSPYNNNIYTDSLIIETSTNGGTSYISARKLWGNSDGGPLNSTGTGFDDFIPSSNQWLSKSYAVPAGTNRIKFRGVSGYGNNLYIDSIKLLTTRTYTQFSIKVMPEGFYNSASDKLNMRDTVKAYLRNVTVPFSKIDSAVSVLDSVSFTGNFNFRNASSGTYYIQVVHRNSIETWSKAGGESMIRGVLKNYDFTSALTQAFGGNMKLTGTRYCIFGGDVNQNGNVDLTDVTLVYNDANNFKTGYVITDLTGNKITDLSDLTLVYNNSVGFVSVAKP